MIEVSACYECSLCHKQYNDLDPAMMCCSEDKAQMAGLSGQALMSMSQAIRMEERAKIVAYGLGETGAAWSRDVQQFVYAIEAGEHLK